MRLSGASGSPVGRTCGSGASIAKMQSCDANSPILHQCERCYLKLVQTDGPLPTGFSPEPKAKVMSLSQVRNLVERVAPAVLLTAMFGLVCGFAAVGMVGVA